MTESNPQNRRLGYARVSTHGQTLDAQLEQLKAAGCVRVYREKVTGARADRRELLKMLKANGPGDVVTVTRSDRLARSTFDLFAIVKQIVDAGAQFRSLAEPWADTGTNTGRLMITVLGGLAAVERDLIRTRTAEGRSRAKARGQHMGRPPKLTPQQQKEAWRRRAEGVTFKELAKRYNVGVATISRLRKNGRADRSDRALLRSVRGTTNGQIAVQLVGLPLSEKAQRYPQRLRCDYYGARKQPVETRKRFVGFRTGCVRRRDGCMGV